MLNHFKYERYCVVPESNRHMFFFITEAPLATEVLLATDTCFFNRGTIGLTCEIGLLVPEKVNGAGSRRGVSRKGRLGIKNFFLHLNEIFI